MDEVEGSRGKEGRGDVVHVCGEKGDLGEMISLCQGVGRFHLEFVLVDTDTLEIGVQPRHCAQPCTGPAADFQERASVSQVTFREQFPGQ